MDNQFDPILLDSETIERLSIRLQEKYKEQWRLSSTPEKREQMYLKVSLIDEVINDLIQLIKEQRGS